MWGAGEILTFEFRERHATVLWRAAYRQQTYLYLGSSASMVICYIPRSAVTRGCSGSTHSDNATVTVLPSFTPSPSTVGKITDSLDGIYKQSDDYPLRPVPDATGSSPVDPAGLSGCS